jgi:hypothetical protein
VPSLVICELLGVPYEDRDMFQHLTGRQLDYAVPVEERNQAAKEMQRYFGRLVERHLADPGDDLIGTLIRQHGEDLSLAEPIGLSNVLLIAGHETTSNMLGLATLLLLENPAQLALMRDDPDSVDYGVEELVRYLSVVHFGFPREVVRPVTVGGDHLEVGTLVLCLIAMANRDPAIMPDADTFDITRKPAPHVAFWSLTATDIGGYLLSGSAGRSSVDSHSGLLANADGSVDILLQPHQPSGAAQNWLAVPPGRFKLMLRAYLPGVAIVDGDYQVPPVVEVRS